MANPPKAVFKQLKAEQGFKRSLSPNAKPGTVRRKKQTKK